MKSELPDSSLYTKYLLLLGVVFTFRVFAQFVQMFDLISFLPSFSEWHSATLPYPLLFSIQLIIIFTLGVSTWKLYVGAVDPSYMRGKAMLLFGATYFSLMLLRLLLGLFVLTNYSWLDAIIPTSFHLVLASFIIVYGHYHYNFGRKPDAERN